MPTGRYRYDDDRPEAAIRDLFEGNGSRGYEHPALYRLAERVVHALPAVPGGANRAARRTERIWRRALGAIMPRTRHVVSRQLSA